jgi:hypothetical protein
MDLNIGSKAFVAIIPRRIEVKERTGKRDNLPIQLLIKAKKNVPPDFLM